MVQLLGAKRLVVRMNLDLVEIQWTKLSNATIYIQGAMTVSTWTPCEDVVFLQNRQSPYKIDSIYLFRSFPKSTVS